MYEMHQDVELNQYDHERLSIEELCKDKSIYTSEATTKLMIKMIKINAKFIQRHMFLLQLMIVS